MCLTEPHAGSDVGAAKTRARRNPDGTSTTSRGTKIFISGGDHDLAENIIHLVLARVEGAPRRAPRACRCSSCPRCGSTTDGSLGEPNDVTTGIHRAQDGHQRLGHVRAQLRRERRLPRRAWSAAAEHQGMRQMFQMMNGARIAVGVQGLAVASTRLPQRARVREGAQAGRHSIQNWKDPNAPRVPIIEHADVRRMLLDMKAHVEGIRALAVKLAMHTDTSPARWRARTTTRPPTTRARSICSCRW